jgi:type II secretion system protein I
MRQNKNAFTLMEVLVALAITAISVIPLLQLLVTSISMMDSAGCLSHASLIANEKLAETVSRGYPELGTQSGIIDNKENNVVYNWQVNITDAQQKELAELNLTGLRKVNVCVKWKHGQARKQVCMSTLVSRDKEIVEAVSREKSVSEK